MPRSYIFSLYILRHFTYQPKCRKIDMLFKPERERDMKIYIDFDDVICETAKFFSDFAKELFDVDVPYSQMHDFNMQKTFGLNDEQYDELLKGGHIPENLLKFEETPGASDTINSWIDKGHEVYVITGRPFDAYTPSRQWLDNHNLKRIPMYCVDKYGRENFSKDWSYSMTLSQLYDMDFDFAIEDSPVAFEHVLHFENAKNIAVFDRPWNKNAAFPNDKFIRCPNWQFIDKVINEL